MHLWFPVSLSSPREHFPPPGRTTYILSTSKLPFQENFVQRTHSGVHHDHTRTRRPPFKKQYSVKTTSLAPPLCYMEQARKNETIFDKISQLSPAHGPPRQKQIFFYFFGQFLLAFPMLLLPFRHLSHDLHARTQPRTTFELFKPPIHLRKSGLAQRLLHPDFEGLDPTPYCHVADRVVCCNKVKLDLWGAAP